MDTKNQFAYFLLSVAIGFVGGLLYELFALVRLLFRVKDGKRKALGVGIDITFCICFAILCIYASFFLHFPDFRGYMCIGWLVGGIIYLKILHRNYQIISDKYLNVCIKLNNLYQEKPL